MARVSRTAFLILLCTAGPLLYPGAASTQTGKTRAYDANRKFTHEELTRDFLIFRKALQEAHPNLYRYTTPAALDAEFAKAEASFNREMMTELEFYKVLASVLSAIKDGHTRSLPSESFMDWFPENVKIFPPKLRFLAGKPFILDSPDGSIPPGSELLSINGKPVAEITRTLFRHLVSDGDIQTGKYRELDEKFGFYYSSFVERPDSFQIEFRDPAKGKRSARIAAATLTRTED